MFKLGLIHNTRFNFIKVSTKRLFSSRVGPIRSPRIKSLTLGVCGFSAITGLALYNHKLIELDNKKQDISLNHSIAVDSSISPFPTALISANQTNLNTDFQLLGYGVRSVTFVNFKVYGIGLYIANDDVSKTKKILSPDYLSTFGTENHSLRELLSDPEFSAQLISKLLNENVRFAVRISPVRNTDFNHLKDGLIKSILAHPESKENKEIVSNGLEELRNVFSGYRGSVPKNHVLWLEILKQGSLSISYENPVKNELISMGQVKEPIISKLLFLQYLSGKKPLSEPLRKSCNDGFIGL
ncbi:unnamed protein product [Debaryomyces tyrocola]|nr:unnamed protein product [Debaryomyces tyrocola]